MNSIFNLKNIKISRIIILILVSIGIFFFIVDNFYSDYKLFDLLFTPLELRTTREHQKTLGIKIANISDLEEKKLESMIDESVKAQLEYYSTKKDESLEKVRSLYLIIGFEHFKKSVKRVTTTTEETQKYYEDEKLEFSIQSYDKIESMKFSRPVIYKDLSDRVGMMNYTKFNNDTNNLSQVFIFKNISGEWKIEKQREIVVRPEITEELIIKEIEEGK